MKIDGRKTHVCRGIECNKKIQGHPWKTLCKECWIRMKKYDPQPKSQTQFKAQMKFQNPRSTWRYTQ